MIGGSPAPPNCPMRRLESCSNGWLVCELISGFRLRLEVFFFGLVCLFLFLFIAIKSPEFLDSNGQPLARLVDNPHRTSLRAIVALLLVPLYAGTDLQSVKLVSW